jgi:Raf kinase inhibitor-like YbhB/YbcL family protein
MRRRSLTVALASALTWMLVQGCASSCSSDGGAPMESDDDAVTKPDDDGDDDAERDAGGTKDAAAAKDAGNADRGMPDAARAANDAGRAAPEASTPLDAGGASEPNEADADTQAPKADGGGASNDAQTGGALTLTSEAVKDGEQLPNEYRCMGMAVPGPSPAFAWSGAPAGTRSWAIVMRDITNASFIINHWFIFDIPAATTSLPKAVPQGAMLTDPAGAKQGPNYNRERGYRGPCGGDNRYEFTLYALDVETLPGLGATSTAAQINEQINMHDLGSANLTVRSKPQ